MPGVPIALEGIVTATWVLLTEFGVKDWLLKVTIEVLTKLSPLRIRAKSGLLAIIEAGSIEDKEGRAFRIVKVHVFDEPPPGEGLEALMLR